MRLGEPLSVYRHDVGRGRVGFEGGEGPAAGAVDHLGILRRYRSLTHFSPEGFKSAARVYMRRAVRGASRARL